jgi:hypothetical protein
MGPDLQMRAAFPRCCISVVQGCCDALPKLITALPQNIINAFFRGKIPTLVSLLRSRSERVTFFASAKIECRSGIWRGVKKGVNKLCTT